jgi:DNA-binding transcriptional ArsR family regulator
METRKLERVVKGFANHRRIQILELLAREPELSLAEISGRLRIDMKTASEHVRRLAAADLVVKRSEGRWVRHHASARGDDVLTFLRMLDSQAERR